MSRYRSALVPFAAIFAVLALIAIPSGATGDVGAEAAKSSHKSGKYKGKVGTFARISFKASSKKVKKLNAGVQGSCQRASDGQITRIQLVAMQTKKKLKIKSNGKFNGKGQEDNGVSWEIKGRFVSKKKAKGTFEASEFVFNPFTFDSELCAGSGKWSATLKR